MWHKHIFFFLKIHRLVIQSTEFQLVDEWKKPPQWQCPGCPVEKESLVCDPPSFCSCKMCSLFLPWLSHSSKHPASFSFSLSHSCSLSLACAFSITQSLSLSLSPCLSLALLLLHTDRVVKGARPRLRAEQTALLLLQPSWWEGLEQICARERSRHRPAGCSVSTTWENAGNRSGDERGWRQREQSIPPTGYTRSYRLEYCVFTQMLSLPNLSRLNSKTSYVQ